jgi:hypothetical protein
MSWISSEMMRDRSSGPFENYGEMLYAESLEAMQRKREKVCSTVSLSNCCSHTAQLAKVQQQQQQQAASSEQTACASGCCKTWQALGSELHVRHATKLGIA